MNKVFKLKKGSHGLKVVSELAKSHSGERAVTGSGFGGFGSAFLAKFGRISHDLLGDDGLFSHAGKKTVSFSVVALLSLFSPFTLGTAWADLTADEEAQVRALINNIKQNGGGNATAFAGGTITGGGTTNIVAFAGGTAGSNGENIVAWGGGTALTEKSTAWGDGTKASGNRSTAWGDHTEASGNRATAWGGKTIASGIHSTAWGNDTQANGTSSTTWGTGTYAGGLEKTDITEGTLGEKFQSAAQLCNAVGAGSSPVCRNKPSLMEVYNWYLNVFGPEEKFREAVGFIEKGGVDGSKGENATAFGKDTIAGNDQATAFGENSIANGVNSTAFGLNSYAYADNSLAALGGKVGDKKDSNSTYHSTIGVGSVAIGENAWVASNNSYAFGNEATVYVDSNNSVALGSNSKVGTETISAPNAFAAVGGNAIDKYDIAIGNGAQADSRAKDRTLSQNNDQNTNAIAIGNKAKARGDSAVAIGNQADAYDYYSIALGMGSVAVEYDYNKNLKFGIDIQNSVDLNTDLSKKPVDGQNVAIGSRAFAIGGQAIAIGADTMASGVGSVAIGGDDIGKKENPENAASLQAYKDLMGGEDIMSERARILLHLFNGNCKVGGGKIQQNNGKCPADLIGPAKNRLYIMTTANGVGSSAIGQGSRSLGTFSTAIGFTDLASGIASNAIGTQNIAEGDGSTVIGLENQSYDKNTTAIGVANVIGKENSINSNTANDSVAIGNRNKITAQGDVAIGIGNYVSGEKSIALGSDNNVSGKNSGAFGDPSNILTDQSYKIGNDSYFGKDAQKGETENDTTSNNIFSLGNRNIIGKSGNTKNVYVVGSDNDIDKVEHVYVLGSNVSKVIGNSVFLGDGTAYVIGTSTGEKTEITSATINGVTYGNFAGSEPIGVVSVGNATAPRRIQNVAAGLISPDSTDAINGSQLYATSKQLQWKVGYENTNLGQVGEINATTDRSNVYFVAGNKGITITGEANASKNGYDIIFTPKFQEANVTDGKITGITYGDKYYDIGGNNVNNLYWTALDGDDDVNATGTGDNKGKQVKAGDQVKFHSSDNSILVDRTDGDFDFKINQQPVVYTTTNGDKVTKVGNKWYKLGDDGKITYDDEGKITDEEVTNPNDIIASMNNINGKTTDNPDGTTNNVILGNVASHFGDNYTHNSSATGDKNAPISYTYPTGGNANVLNQAATMKDLLNAGWNLKVNTNGGADDGDKFVDFVTHADTVNFVSPDKSVIVDGEYDNNTKTSTIKFSVNTGESSVTNGKADIIYKDENGNILTPVKDNNGNITNYKKADGSDFTGDTNKITNSGDKVATVGDIVDTVNKMYWNVSSDDNLKQQIQASDSVKFIGGDGIKITQTNKDSEGNVTFKFDVEKVSGDGTTIVSNGDTLSVNKTDTAVDENGKATTNPTTGTTNDGENVVKDGDKWYVAKSDGTPDKTKEVPENRITKNDGGFVTAKNIAETINNTYWTIDATGNGDNSGDSNDKKAQNINPGGKVELVGGTGVNVDQYGSKFTFNVDTGKSSVTDGKADTNTYTTGDDNKSVVKEGDKYYTTNPDGSKTEINEADVKKTDNADKVATVGDIANTINNMYWTASDGDKNTSVKAGNRVTWEGGTYTEVKLDESSNTFLINSTLKFEKDEDGNVTIRDGETELVTINKVIDTNTQAKVTVGGKEVTKDEPKVEGNIILTGKDLDTNTPTYDLALNNNLKLENGSIKITKGDKNVSIEGDNVDMGGNQIHNVAEGTAPTDAVNVSQLKKFMGYDPNEAPSENKDFKEGDTIGDSTVITEIKNVVVDKDGKPMLRTYNVKDRTEYWTNNIVEAVDKMNNQGIKFFHTNDGTVEPTAQAKNTIDASAAGKYSTAIGYKAEVGENGESSIAIGNSATVTGKDSIAIGRDSNVTGKNSIAIGTGHQISGNNSGAFGDPAYIKEDNAYAIGNNNEISGEASFILGNDSNVTTENTFVIGSNVKPNTTLANSVFLGNDTAYVKDDDSNRTKGASEYTGDTKVYYAKDQKVNLSYAGGDKDEVVGVISVGSDKQTRRIQNVAPGYIKETSTDAINGSQLYASNKAIQVAMGKSFTVDENSGMVVYNNPKDGIAGTGNVTLEDAIKAAYDVNVAPDDPAIKVRVEKDDKTGAKTFYIKSTGAASNPYFTAKGKGGDNAQATANNATAMGPNAQATHENSVAIGAGSKTDAPNTVSVGSPGNERRITNVAPGVNDTDAVNVSQLKGLANSINQIKKDNHAGIAGAMAMTGLPQPIYAGKGMLSAAVGHYDDESALAVGLSKVSDNGKWVFKSSLSVDTQENIGANVGIGFQW